MANRHRRRREVAPDLWDKSREWKPKYAARLRQAVIEDCKQGRYGRDLYAKLRERSISEQDVLNTVASPKSYVMRFRHADGTNRVGFWNPKTKLLIIWVPRRDERTSFVISCFRKNRAIAYMREYTGEY